MKFKQYVKESVTPANKVTLDENFLDNDYNLDRPSPVQDELDRFYAPVNKLIADGKFDEAKKELDELEADLNDLEATNSKKKFFKFPQFMIDGQRRRIDALRAKLLKNESIEDMDRRCEKCNTLLTDGGTCPKCDDGEEDYGDELKEACSDYHVKKYGAYWFGIIGPDGLMLRDENNKLRLFKNKAAAQKFIDETCNQLNEEMGVREKLKAAYPELNFANPVTEECVKEELSNREKLKRAFPELNFDKEPLTEGTGADTAHAVRDTMNNLAKDNKNQWAKKTAEVIDAVPDSFMDELFENVKKNLANVKLNSSDKKKIIDAADDTVSEEAVEGDTLGSILNAIDITEWSKKNPKFVKTFLIVVLGIIAVIEPTPVVEIITGIIMLIPDHVVAKIASILSVVTNPAAAGVVLANKAHNAKNEALSARAKLKAAYPELDFGDNVDEGLVNINLDASGQSVGLLGGTGGSVLNSSLDPDEFDYDDDYEMDDVEQDRAHAALYGGDRMYCDCGKKLAYDEWGSYCPDCNPRDPEEDYIDNNYHDASEHELRKTSVFDNLDDNIDENFEYRSSSQSTCC